MRKTLASLAVVLCAAPPAVAKPLITMTGRGWGHGVGMSQSGAEGMARDGALYDAILAHYYPGTTLEERPGERMRVLLRDTGNARIVAADGASAQADAGARTPVAGALRALPGGEPGQVRLVDAAGDTVAAGALVRIRAGDAPTRVAGNAYRGDIVLRRSGARVRVVNHVPLSDYVRGVIAWEMPASWSPEALRAQAVAARTYALAERRGTGTFDVYPDTRSQMYGGVGAETETTDEAVAATDGQVLTYEGAVITAFFHSSSGGRTANVEDVWSGGPVPYLVSVPDPGDRIARHHRWPPKRYGATELGRLLGTGAVRRIAIARNPSRRVETLTVTGAAGSRTLTGGAVRSELGLRSTWFAFRLLDLRRARLVDGAIAVTGRSSPDGRVGLDGLVDGRWVRLATEPSANGVVRFSVPDDGTATRVRLRAGDAISYSVRLLR